MVQVLVSIALVVFLAGNCGGGGGADGGAPMEDGGPPPADAGQPGDDGGPGEEIVPGQRETDLGTVMGTVDEDGIEAYRGIRYGVAPTGRARFEEATAPETTGAIDATAFGDVCPQADPMGEPMSDDCLRLNVWTRTAWRRSSPRPVMVFIHGGGFVAGSGNFDASPFTRDDEVLIVTLNYRLGLLGSAAIDGVPSNLGMRDQQAALRWVQSHIASFGGDPSNVTLFGESAGGHAVCAHLASPVSAGLFHAAIDQSGTCLQPAASRREAVAADLLGQLGCADLDCLAALPSADIIAAAPTERHDWFASGHAPFGYWVDGELLLDSPHRVLADPTHPRVPFILGANEEESLLFASVVFTCPAYDRWLDEQATWHDFTADEVRARYPCGAGMNAIEAWQEIVDDVRFHCPAGIATANAAPHGPVYRYVLERGRDRGLFAGLGAYHSVEIPLMFELLDLSPEDLVFGRELRRIWTGFATEHEPPADLGWPAYDGTRSYLRLDDTHTVEQDHRATICEFWTDGRLPLL